MYMLIRLSTMAKHVLCTISQTVDLATPKRCAIVRCSVGIAKHHRVIATRCSTDIDRRITIPFIQDGIKPLTNIVKGLPTHTKSLLPEMSGHPDITFLSFM